MRLLRKLAYSGAFLCASTTPVFAANVFMLQFGSYQTAEEAQSHLNDLNAKHPGTLSRLQTSVRTVTLPPDNLTVYRTQAGPLASRGDAQSVCSQLASNGDECYVVESAMSSVSSASPAPTPPAPEPKPVMSEVATQSSNPSPAAIPAPVMLSSTEQPATDASIHQALDNASANQEMPQTTTASQPRRSFWERVNPFSSDEPAPAAAAMEPETAVESIPSKTVVPVSVPASNISMASNVAPAPAVAPAPVAAIPPAPLGEIPPPSTPAPAILTSNSVPNFPLPPPPPPLIGSSKPAYSASPAAPVAMASVPAMNAPALAPAPNAAVHVEEAKRVPLSQMSAPPVVAPASPVFRQIPNVDLSPSSTDGQRTLWAQMGPFNSAQAALAYWTNFRQTHPDFPVVRVRVTTSLAAAQRGLAETNLRVGPFARAEFIRSLCGSLPEDDHLQCGTVADLGASASPSSGRLGFLNPSRYKR